MRIEHTKKKNGERLFKIKKKLVNILVKHVLKDQIKKKKKEIESENDKKEKEVKRKPRKKKLERGKREN